MPSGMLIDNGCPMPKLASSASRTPRKAYLVGAGARQWTAFEIAVAGNQLEPRKPKARSDLPGKEDPQFHPRNQFFSGRYGNSPAHALYLRDRVVCDHLAANLRSTSEWKSSPAAILSGQFVKVRVHDVEGQPAVRREMSRD